MITTGTTIKKVRSDIAKLNKAEQKEGGRSHLSVRKWLITRDRLETEHVTLANNNNVTAVTHAQFRRLFFDAKDYLAKRLDAPFGSARDLRKDSITIPTTNMFLSPCASSPCSRFPLLPIVSVPKI